MEVGYRPLSTRARRIYRAMQLGATLVERGYSYDEQDSDGWLELGRVELHGDEALEELVKAGLIGTADKFSNPTYRVYQVLK